ncbi:MAG TPA: NTP transferase domain-containing protein [Thermoflexia bacterium]|nr:NTP transferase domain-containing protein [Thermoflexia bacterium]
MQPLKAIVLAASPSDRDGAPYFKILEPLGQQLLIDYVIEEVLRFVAPSDLYVVTGYQGEQVRAHLGPRFNYLTQKELHGTGHAVLQAASPLHAYQGDILILYGDTPLFRTSSIQGLLNRHRLKAATLTLLTATVTAPYPYGHIIRDTQGWIVDIVEATAAPGKTKAGRELNVGAYVARAAQLFQALTQLERPGEHLPLTDVIHSFARAGKRIISYRSQDPDEILGINSPEDLKEAELILQKRYFQPIQRQQENRIHFGTGGWRAVIGEGFTFANVRRLSQALANQITRQDQESQGVLIGYDRRFLSDRAAEAAAEVFAGNNIPVTLLNEAVPTPLVTYATAQQERALGLVFTASHNPPEWNGLKVFHTDGSLLPTEETNRIEAEANALPLTAVVRLELPTALNASIVRHADCTNRYVDAVEAQVDMQAIRDAGLRVAIDPMYGAGQATLEIVLTEARCRVTTIHGRHDPLFGGRSPAPNLRALRMLITIIKEGRYDLGMATDGDGDRIALVDAQGNYISTNDVLLLLYYHLHQTRDLRGGVVRNLATTHLLDRLAAHFGEQSLETPVGFKHIVAGMQAQHALLGGESSGGLTVRGHILGKDGILSAALIVEMLALTGKQISELLAEIYAITGRLYAAEENIPATSEMKVIIPQQLREQPLAKLGPYPVQKISHLDGVKFLLDNDNWLLMRFSGTEPILRIFSEADSPAKAQELLTWIKKYTGIKG